MLPCMIDCRPRPCAHGCVPWPVRPLTCGEFRSAAVLLAAQGGHDLGEPVLGDGVAGRVDVVGNYTAFRGALKEVRHG